MAHQFISDIYTTISNCIMAATREKLVAIASTSGGYFLVRESNITPEATKKLLNYKTVLIIVEGKMTKCALNKTHFEWYKQEVKRINNLTKN